MITQKQMKQEKQWVNDDWQTFAKTSPEILAKIEREEDD